MELPQRFFSLITSYKQQMIMTLDHVTSSNEQHIVIEIRQLRLILGRNNQHDQ